jgi:hypothetical protein
MLHVIVVAFALFVNAEGNAVPAEAITKSPMACATLLNTSHIIKTDDGDTYYMTKGECDAYYVNESGTVVSTEGNYTEPKAHHAAKHRPI